MQILQQFTFDFDNTEVACILGSHVMEQFFTGHHGIARKAQLHDRCASLQISAGCETNQTTSCDPSSCLTKACQASTDLLYTHLAPASTWRCYNNDKNNPNMA